MKPGEGFTIVLKFKHLTLNGIQALDWRRAHGLKDGIWIRFDDRESIAKFDVDEGFARAWFPATADEMQALVDANMLSSGEIIENAGSFSFNVTPERAKEIYLAVNASHSVSTSGPITDVTYYGAR